VREASAHESELTVRTGDCDAVGDVLEQFERFELERLRGQWIESPVQVNSATLRYPLDDYEFEITLRETRRPSLVARATADEPEG
jgi:hypothetical protein